MMSLRPSGIKRHPLAQVLSAALLFEFCVLTGVLASPFFREWAPRSLLQAADPAAMLARWRQSVSRGADLREGALAPWLSLRTAAGRPLELAALHGKKVALLFAEDGGG